MEMSKLLFYGVCALVFLIPVSVSPASFAEGLVLTVWVVSGRFLSDLGIIRRKWSWPAVAMIVLPWVGLLYSHDMAAGLKFAEKSHYWLYSFIAAGIVLSGFEMDGLLKAFIAGVTFTSVVYLCQLAGLVYQPTKTSIAFFGHDGHIEFSLLATFSITLLSFFFAKAEKTKHKVLCAGLMMLQFFDLTLVLADSGHLAFILLTPLIAYNLLGRKRLRWAFAGGVVLVCLMFLSPVAQSRLKQAVKETAAYGKGQVLTPLGFHYYVWEGAAKIFSGHPIAGTGTGGYTYNMHKIKQAGMPEVAHPQNTLLYMAASYGVPGIIVLIFLWAMPIRAAWRERNSLKGFSVLIFMAILSVGSITDTQIMSYQSGILFALFYGIALAQKRTGAIAEDLEKVP